MTSTFTAGHTAKRRFMLSASVVALVAVNGAFAGTAHAQSASGQSTASQGAPAHIETVEVTGSYINRAEDYQSSPLLVLNSDDIAKTGYSSIEGLLSLNTANIGSIGGTQDLVKGGSELHNTRSANLRGLGPGATLVLLDGNRLADPDGYTSLSALVPMIAVARVETVLDGASATYGSDAIAGVINIITDDEFNGLAASAQYTDIADAPGYIAQAKLGGGSGRFHAMVAVSYEYQQNLQNGSRAVTNIINTSGYSQPGNFTLLARPTAPGGGDLIINNGVDGPVDYTALYDAGHHTVADPDCDVPGTGGLFQGSAKPPVGPCKFSYQAVNPIIPTSAITMAYAHASYAITQDDSFYVDARFYEQAAGRYGVASLPLSSGAQVTVPASAPYNQFGVPLLFSGRALGSTQPLLKNRSRINNDYIVTGLKGHLFDSSWHYDFRAEYDEGNLYQDTPDTNMIALQNAINGFGGKNCPVNPYGVPAAGQAPGAGNCYYFSPFGIDAAKNPPDVLYNILAPVQSDTIAQDLLVQGVVTGNLFDLPGGPLAVAIGGQWRSERFDTIVDEALQYAQNGFTGKSIGGSGLRNVKSVFAEVDAPLMKNLDVQLAARYEDYGKFTTFDPKIGANWSPFDWLLLRASFSRAFQAPSIGQSNSDAVTAFTAQTHDPLIPSEACAGCAGTFRVVNLTNNPNLKPETSTNYNAGVTVSPIENLSLSMDYWKFDFKDQITQQSPDVVILANSVAPATGPQGPAIKRDALGNLLSVTIGYFNAGSTSTSGIDLSGTYVYQLGNHTFTLHDAATWIDTYVIQNSPTSASFSAVGRRNASTTGAPTPRLRDNFTIDWNYGHHDVIVGMRYTGGVIDDLGITGAVPAGYALKVKPWTVFDVQYSYTFGSERTYKITIGAVNVFDQAPPSALFTGYLPNLGEDALGREPYIRLDVKT